MQAGYKRIGKVCQLECLTGIGEKREDLTIPELGVHLDVVIGALDEIGDNNYPALDLGGDGRVKTALQVKAFVASLVAAQRVAFGTLTRLAAEKRIHHSPAVVTLLAVSAGGGMYPEDDDRLPCGADRNGRQWLRVELSSTLLKYRTLSWGQYRRGRQRPGSTQCNRWRFAAQKGRRAGQRQGPFGCAWYFALQECSSHYNARVRTYGDAHANGTSNRVPM